MSASRDDQSDSAIIRQLLSRFPGERYRYPFPAGALEPPLDAAVTEVIRRFMEDTNHDVVVLLVGDIIDDRSLLRRDPNRTLDEDLRITLEEWLSILSGSSSQFYIAPPVTPDYVDDVREALHDCGA